MYVGFSVYRRTEVFLQRHMRNAGLYDSGELFRGTGMQERRNGECVLHGLRSGELDVILLPPGLFARIQYDGGMLKGYGLFVWLPLQRRQVRPVHVLQLL